MITRLLRTQVVAVVATSVDLALSWLLLVLLPVGDMPTALAVVVGAVAGAATACTLNHLWSFKGNGNRPMTVVSRYGAVWIGSVVINTGGTVLLSHWLAPAIVARAVVAVAVGCLWNYPLMACYVYRRGC